MFNKQAVNMCFYDFYPIKKAGNRQPLRLISFLLIMGSQKIKKPDKQWTRLVAVSSFLGIAVTVRVSACNSAIRMFLF